MKLYIKQKVFSWHDQFTVKDVSGVDRYFVEGELFSWGKKLHVIDVFGNEVAFIQQKLWSFLPKYDVFIGGTHIAEIKKEFTFLKPCYTIEGLNWVIEGDFLGHHYAITQYGRAVVSIQKEWFTWGDSYALDITSPQDEIYALAVVLAIDCVVAQQSNN